MVSRRWSSSFFSCRKNISINIVRLNAILRAKTLFFLSVEFSILEKGGQPIGIRMGYNIRKFGADWSEVSGKQDSKTTHPPTSLFQHITIRHSVIGVPPTTIPLSTGRGVEVAIDFFFIFRIPDRSLDVSLQIFITDCILFLLFFIFFKVFHLNFSRTGICFSLDAFGKSTPPPRPFIIVILSPPPQPLIFEPLYVCALYNPPRG